MRCQWCHIRRDMMAGQREWLVVLLSTLLISQHSIQFYTQTPLYLCGSSISCLCCTGPPDWKIDNSPDINQRKYPVEAWNIQRKTFPSSKRTLAIKLYIDWILLRSSSLQNQWMSSIECSSLSRIKSQTQILKLIWKIFYYHYVIDKMLKYCDWCEILISGSCECIEFGGFWYLLCLIS